MRRWSIALLAALVWSAPALAQPPVPPEARARLDRGEQLFAASAWDAALAEYEAAYAALDGHPSRYMVLFNIAQCHERAARYDGALHAYQRYLDEGGARDPDAGEVRARIGVLEGLLGTLDVTLRWPGAAAEAELWVSGRRVGAAPGSVRLPGGTHSVEVRAPGYERASEVVTLTAGATRSIAIAMRHLGRGLNPTIFWTTSGAAAVALALGGALGSYALVRHDELASIEPQALRTRAELAELASVALAADVSFAIGGALGVAALVLAFLTDFSASSAQVAPWVAPDALGVALSGAIP